MKLRPLFLIPPLIISTHTLALRLSWPISIPFHTPASTFDFQSEPWIHLLRARELPGLSKSEIESLFLNTQSLNAYANKPDCFKRAATRIRFFCGSIDREGMDADQRVRAAIMMTLCELNTALQPPPLECAAFGFTTLSSSALPLDHGTDQMQEQAENQAPCVSALSRSPQSWSSYSGYLREVPQLCHAFRRWNDIDTARNIYANLTLEKLSLLRHLHLREKRWEEGTAGWAGVVKDLQIILQTIQTSLDSRKGQLHRFEKEFNEKLDHFKYSLMALKTQEEAGYIHSLSRVDDYLDGVVRRHEQSLLMLLPSLDRTLSGYLSELLVRNREAFEFSNQVSERWTELEADFMTMHNSIKSLSSFSTTLSNSLIDSQVLSHSILNTQLRTRSAIERMAELTQEAIGKINDTAVGVIEGMQERLRVETKVGWKVWNVVVSILGKIVDPIYIDQLNNLPLPRIAFSLFTVLWYIFRFAFSSLMSVLVVLVSSKRFFSGVFSVHDYNIDLHSQAQSQSRHSSPQNFIQLPTTPPTPSQILDPDPRLLHLYIRPGTRFSRIPDRLCKPKYDVTSHHLGWK